MNQQEIEEKVKTYYNEKLDAFGPTPKGVDWNGEESQKLRFQQLSKLIDSSEAFSLLDYGCGYGALYPFLQEKYGNQLSYLGYDISAEMIDAAQKEFPHGPVFLSEMPSTPVDYVVASGIFNVKMAVDEKSWEEYMEQKLQEMDTLSTRGFAFNVLSSYSDPPFQKAYLYYAKPERWFGYCKRFFSSRVALLHDYPLYEFCIIIRK